MRRAGIVALALACLALTGCFCDPFPFPDPPPRTFFDAGPPPDAFSPDAFEVLPICARLFELCGTSSECGGQACVMSSTRTVPVRPGLSDADAGVGDAGVFDAGVFDAGALDAGALDAGVLDAGDAGAFDASITGDAGVMEGVPDRIALVRFARRVCTSECDVSDPDACGPCGSCIDWTPLGSARIPLGAGICHLRCEIDEACPAGYVCHPEGVCVRGCQPRVGYSECGLHGIDDDGDGLDEAVYYEAPDSRCEAGRCVPPLGSPCSEDAECGGAGRCMVAVGQSIGMCVANCGVTCDEGGGVCSDAGAGVRYCSPPCDPGSEPPEDRSGPSGHGAGCAPGFACEQGCVPGNYNALSSPNLGAPCLADDECFSPYGAGMCAGATTSTEGICSVRCAHLLDVVDDPERVCDTSAGQVCDPGGCIAPCGAPEDCAVGLACSTLPGGSARTCRVECNGIADCRVGESCRSTERGGSECLIGERGCRCGA